MFGRIRRPPHEQLFELFGRSDKLHEAVNSWQPTVAREPKPVRLCRGQANEGGAARQAGMRPAAEAAEVRGGAGWQRWARARAKVDDAVDRVLDPAQTEGGSPYRLMVILPIPGPLGDKAQGAFLFVEPFKVDGHWRFPLVC